MSTYIITDRTQQDGHDAAELREPVFPAIFTDPRAAERFLSGMEQECEISRLNAMELLRWMIRVYEQGTHYLLVNPRSAWSAGHQPTAQLAIEQQLARFAELLTRDVVACATAERKDRHIVR